jgi:2-octaprenylphenol hydroxylase
MAKNERKSRQFDVVIVGGGLVGAALAAALGGGALDIALIESRPPEPAGAAALIPGENWDSRVYAINPESVRFLTEIGAWAEIEPARLTAVRQMEIFGDEGKSRIGFDAMATGVPELAWIVEGKVLLDAIWRVLGQQKNLSLFRPAQCTALSVAEGRASISLDGGTRLSAQLVVGADGAHSWLREAAGMAATERSYHEVGVVANFATAREHEGTAYQWFRPEGTLAYLPLPGKRLSMVWAAQAEFARELLGLAPETLAQRVAAAGCHQLGELQLLTAAQGFPLRLLSAARSVASCVALVGDAAHVVHPLAGQGVNLGFADAEALAAEIARRESFRGCGDSRLLRRYERRRREQHFAIECVTDGLQRLFSSENRALRQMRNRGLELVDALPVLKNLLARRALGTA